MEVKIWSLCSVSSILSHANLEQPFRTLAIKWEVNMYVKEVFLRFYPSCFFLLASLSCVVYSCVCLWYCVFVMLMESADDNTTLSFWISIQTRKLWNLVLKLAVLIYQEIKVKINESRLLKFYQENSTGRKYNREFCWKEP